MDSENKLAKFYVCKHCHRKVNITFLAQHVVREHIDKNYIIVEHDTQTIFEIQNNEITGKVELTKDEANKKYGFST